jgi:ADP-heptose:LPS heptosyltransferase
MKTAIGFNLGMRGDVVMNTVAARSFKTFYYGSVLVLGIGPQYADMIPLFKNHPYFDAVHVYDSYDGWPNPTDKEYLVRTRYDHVFNGMPQHTSDKWFQIYHQCEEVCAMHGLNVIPDYSCELTKWFDDNTLIKDKKFIAFAPFAGYYNKGNDKKLSIEKAQQIANVIIDRGYDVLQLGGPDEPRLNKVHFMYSDYFNSVRNMISCKALVHTDTGLGWVASAYKFPCLGLYSNAYYGEKIKNIQPINPNAIYLDSENVNNIDIELIRENLKTLLK